MMMWQHHIDQIYVWGINTKWQPSIGHIPTHTVLDGPWKQKSNIIFKHYQCIQFVVNNLGDAWKKQIEQKLPKLGPH